MEWVFRSPQIHSTFGNLGFLHADGYQIYENCYATLENILHNILTEDKYFRTFRRSISCGQNVQKDLVPLLIHTKEDKNIESIVKILVNLTIPVECLVSVEVTSQSDFGRHTVFDLNNLLQSTKAAFTDSRVTKVIIDFLKKNVDAEKESKLSQKECTNITNILLLLRNVLHIPTTTTTNNGSQNSTNTGGSDHTAQNQILWNIFSQSIDKILIKLMNIPEASNWGVAMVQLIGLLYKDQHAGSLHKFLDTWLESNLSESSEDNESNTTPPDRDARGSANSSPMLTSYTTSDSFDAVRSTKFNDEPSFENNGWGAPSEMNSSENSNAFPDGNDFTMKDRSDHETNNNDEHTNSEKEEKVMSRSVQSEISDSKIQPPNSEKHAVKSVNSDCWYATQIENQESISTSSNDDDVPAEKPVHKKPHNPKQRANTKMRMGALTLHDRKRKKIVKRSKANITNVQGLTHKTPTDDDISNVLREFTVDFLIKGYNSLIQTLHSQILTNIQLEIDTSHFFWLVTYFLKFATQIQLDLQQISSVLSFDIVSYLIAEGVNLCEQFELTIKLDGNDLKPSKRRLHLVVTAIREFVQAIEMYKKFTHISAEDQKILATLQSKMCETDELRSLLILLLRTYNPKYHSKQYLQDLIVTNHILLLFLDREMRSPGYTGPNMADHLQQFATPEMMYQYGLLLEDYMVNGEFVNDCVFTVMHHVGGELGSLICLFQPKILKTFTSMWESDYEICDDWSDLIEYVINTFVKKPHALQRATTFRLDTENFDDDMLDSPTSSLATDSDDHQPPEAKRQKLSHSGASNISKESRWTEDELSSLNWMYLQCNTSEDVVGEIVECFKEDGITKSRESVIKEMLNQNIISIDDFDKYSKMECDIISENKKIDKEIRDVEIRKLSKQLRQDGKMGCFDWVQTVLLKTCYAKLCIGKKSVKCCQDNFEESFLEEDDLPIVSPVSYHSLFLQQSVPLVPWNYEQASICKDLKFLQLLHKLGFQMPVDTGKVFIRIPLSWSAELLYEVAGRVTAIDTKKLHFTLDDLKNGSADLNHSCSSTPAPETNFKIHSHKNLTNMVNTTPMPGSSFESKRIPNDDINSRCWLEVVQQSQALSRTSELETPEHIALPERVLADVTIAEAAIAAVPPLLSGVNGLLSPEPATILSTDPSDLDDNDNISLCETASVASDLTRMYVSAEDEKSDLPRRPGNKIQVPSPVDLFTDVPMN